MKRFVAGALLFTLAGCQQPEMRTIEAEPDAVPETQAAFQASPDAQIKGTGRSGDPDEFPDTPGSQDQQQEPFEPCLQVCEFGDDPNVSCGCLPDPRETEPCAVLCPEGEIPDSSCTCRPVLWDGDPDELKLKCSPGDTQPPCVDFPEKWPTETDPCRDSVCIDEGQRPGQVVLDEVVKPAEAGEDN